MKKMNTDLNRCPYCDGEAGRAGKSGSSGNWVWRISCADAGCLVVEAGTEQGVVAAWNNESHRTLQEQVERLREQLVGLKHEVDYLHDRITQCESPGL